MATLMRYEPLFHQSRGLLNQWRRDMDRMFDRSYDVEEADVTAAAWTPAVDIEEAQDAYILRADLPGVDPQDIEIHMEDGVLLISGERKSEVKEERENYTRVERAHGSFFRRFTLPDTTDADAISAKSGNGVLEVRIPKQEKLQPRRITVQSQ